MTSATRLQPVKDASHLYEVERRARHLQRPGFHISELQHGRTEKTEDVVKKGDIVKVKLLEVDEKGRMRLSRKALLTKE